MLNSLFHFFCHQMPARSPAFRGSTFPLCYRCAGLYGGLLIAYLHLAITGRLWRPFPERNGALAAAAPVAIFLADAWANALGAWSSPGWCRALTGVGAALAIPMLLLPLLGRSRLSPSLHKPAAWIWPAAAGAGFVWLLDHPGSALVFRTLALACALGWAAILANLSLALWEYLDEHHRSFAR